MDMEEIESLPTSQLWELLNSTFEREKAEVAFVLVHRLKEGRQFVDSMVVAEQLRDIGAELEDQRIKGEGNFAIGSTCFALDRYEESAAGYMAAAEDFLAAGEERRGAMALNFAADCYIHLKEFDTAIEVAKRAINLCELNEEQFRYGMLLKLLGQGHMGRDEYSEAAHQYDRAREVFAELGEVMMVVEMLDRGARAQYLAGEVDVAIQMLTEAHLASLSVANDHAASQMCLQLAQIYLDISPLDSRALPRAQQALGYALKANDGMRIGRSRMLLGRCHLAMGDFDAAYSEMSQGMATIKSATLDQEIVLAAESAMLELLFALDDDEVETRAKQFIARAEPFDVLREASARARIGLATFYLGRMNPEAREWLEPAELWEDPTLDASLRMSRLAVMAASFLESEQPETALHVLDSGWALVDEKTDPETLGPAIWLRGSILSQLGDPGGDAADWAAYGLTVHHGPGAAPAEVAMVTLVRQKALDFIRQKGLLR